MACSVKERLQSISDTDNKGFHLLSKKNIINNIFIILVKFSQLGLFSFIKLMMNSKTESDMNYLKTLTTTQKK